MEEPKRLVQEIRGYFALISDRVEALKKEDVELTIEVGTNSKTVTFTKVNLLEMTVAAKVQQEL